MGTTATYTKEGNQTFIVDPADFNGDPIIVEPGATPGTVIPLSATLSNRIGYYEQNLQRGDGDTTQANIRLINSQGTVRVKTSGAFAYGEYALAATGGTVTAEAAAITGCVGQYLGPDVADGAIIEIINGGIPVVVV